MPTLVVWFISANTLVHLLILALLLSNLSGAKNARKACCICCSRIRHECSSGNCFEQKASGVSLSHQEQLFWITYQPGFTVQHKICLALKKSNSKRNQQMMYVEKISKLAAQSTSVNAFLKKTCLNCRVGIDEGWGGTQ